MGFCKDIFAFPRTVDLAVRFEDGLELAVAGHAAEFAIAADIFVRPFNRDLLPFQRYPTLERPL